MHNPPDQLADGRPLPGNISLIEEEQPGKVVAVDFTQNGNMSVAWDPVNHQRTVSFLNLIGPPNQRELYVIFAYHF